MATHEDRSLETGISFREMTPPVLSSTKKYVEIAPGESISSDIVINFLEQRSPIYEFEYSHITRSKSNISLGYEIKTVENINAIYLMINPDPLNFALVPPKSLVISHHKISCYNNRVYKSMLELAQKKQFNIYNFHLAWDTMHGGISDSFMYHLGFNRDEYNKVDLTYKGHKIKNLGSIVKEKYPFDDTYLKKLQSLQVEPSVIVNPQCKNARMGYIPGGGFVDTMIIEIADLGVDVLISADHNWVVETIARELNMTLIEINHYVSEKYGLHSMQDLLATRFPKVPVTVLENIDKVDCTSNECGCSIARLDSSCK
jgi:putative NIF3 family GTP cyclohydrolase 1 type 2